MRPFYYIGPTGIQGKSIPLLVDPAVSSGVGVGVASGVGVGVASGVEAGVSSGLTTGVGVGVGAGVGLGVEDGVSTGRITGPSEGSTGSMISTGVSEGGIMVVPGVCSGSVVPGVVSGVSTLPPTLETHALSTKQSTQIISRKLFFMKSPN
jgi:hypothetical protein